MLFLFAVGAQCNGCLVASFMVMCALLLYDIHGRSSTDNSFILLCSIVGSCVCCFWRVSWWEYNTRYVCIYIFFYVLLY